MYEAYYGLAERPFDLTPNPKFLLLTGKHREALSNLVYGLRSRRGLTLLVGDAGTGKTTVVRTVVHDLEGRGATIAYLNNPTLTRGEFYEFVADAFRLPPASVASKTRLLAELARTLEARLQADALSGLIIDEAQVVPDDLLEEVRLLANIETPTHKLLSIVLAGQPELASRLNQASLRQLKQRVALRCELKPLEARESAEYIASRIRVAGGDPAVLFTRAAVDAIVERSGGIPRLISVLCDNALISGFAADRRPVTRDLVEDVCRDFDLGVPHSEAAPADRAGVPSQAGAPGRPVPVARERAHVRHGPEERSFFEYFNLRRRFSL